MNNLSHESAQKHTTGKAKYIDDLSLNNLLIGYVVTSKIAKGKIISYNVERAKKLKGVYAILTTNNIPGKNNIGPVLHDELILTNDKIDCKGQALFLIAAQNENIAKKAASLIKIKYKKEKPIINFTDCFENLCLMHPERKIERGDVEQITECENVLLGQLETGAQEHWYLETQISIAVPQENGGIKAYSSTQNPTETQILIAEALDLHFSEVEVETNRLGGAFGGKETQGNHLAVWASLLAHATQQPVKIKLFRDTDQQITGKRHPYYIDYKVGFDNYGKIQALDIELNSNAGCATDLSKAIMERAMFHADNAYFIPNIRISGKIWKSNLPSNTAFRGFGAPQAIVAIENIINKIAHYLNKDEVEIRKLNFYNDNNNKTPYGQIVSDNRLNIIFNKIIKNSDYYNRKKDIEKFNRNQKYVKKGIALSPVKFGISFTTSFLNQAGALVNLYTDGSVIIHHGGVEMGQGLNTKIIQIAAKELSINPNMIKTYHTNTSIIPNTAPTAASSGTDLNGMAVKNAIDKLKKRLKTAFIQQFNLPNETEVIFENNWIKSNNNEIKFEELIKQARIQRISLSATGYYKTPDIHYDRINEKGKPFAYYAFGMAVSEIKLDILTGEVNVLQTDILHDVGESINPEIDKGQIEGGFVQGMGWFLMEDCKWDDNGNLLNSSPDTYKIPGIRDIPQKFNIEILKGYPNTKAIRKSKAVGEPPFMLATSVWLAVKNAIAAIGDFKVEPQVFLPFTNENILLSIKQLKNKIPKQNFE